jgi:hypothetical protein
MIFPPQGFNAPADFSVPAHDIAEIQIEFAPQQPLEYSDVMIITTSHPDYPNFFITMQGTGLPGNAQDFDEITQLNKITGNYPNPFNPSTTIIYSLNSSAEVELAIYNLRGEKLEIIETGYKAAGEHQVVWQADQYAAGIYLAKLIAGDSISEHKLILLK